MTEIIDNLKMEFIEPLREFSSSFDKITGKRYEISIKVYDKIRRIPNIQGDFDSPPIYLAYFQNIILCSR